jgi:hypothetical protein
MSRIIVYNDTHVIFEGALLTGDDFIQTADLSSFTTQVGMMIPLGDYSSIMMSAFRGLEHVSRPDGMGEANGYHLVRLDSDNVPRTGTYSGVLFSPFYADPFVVRIIGYGDTTSVIKSNLVPSFTNEWRSDWRVLYRGDPVQDNAIAFAIKDAKTTDEIVSILNEILPIKPYNPITFHYSQWVRDMKEKAKKDKELIYHLTGFKYNWSK